MTRVYDAPHEGPGVHALVIGVESYAMRGWRLNGAARSAAMFCEWLLHPPNREALPVPLASVELLLSADEWGGEFQGCRIDQCTIENVRRAVRAWINLASKDRSGMTVFYCIGHSILRGRDERMLLLDRFGEGEDQEEQWTGEHVVSLLELFHLMAPSDSRPDMARTQLYFFDTDASTFDSYRIAPRQLFAYPTGKGIWDDRIAPIFSAAIPGAHAFGRPGGPSFFLEALLAGLDGKAAQPTGGYRNGEVAWAVTLNSLNRYLETFQPVPPHLKGRMAFGLTGYVRDFVIRHFDRPPPGKALVLARQGEHKSTPSLHALIIGVSYYPFMPTDKARREAFELQQLASPARTAMAIYRWLQQNSDYLPVPLGSVRLLLSPSDEEKAVEPELQSVGDNATRNNVLAAAADWRRDASSDPKNMTFFYFAGHGVQRGAGGDVILLEDFGERTGGLLYNAIDQAMLIAGMAPSRGTPRIARTQFYFFDCCRVKPFVFHRYDMLTTTPVFTVETGMADDR
jgi:caspase domain-containing protein